MKNLARALSAFVLFVVLGSGFFFTSSGFRRPSSLGSEISLASGYCVAIRGNGELMPAHWGALAQTIEAFGMPKAVAGGSSASITSFMIESLAMNPLVQGNQASLYGSFLIKSLQGFTYAIADKPEWKELLGLMNQLNQGQSNSLGSFEFAKLLEGQTPEQVMAQVGRLTSALKGTEQSKLFTGPGIVKLAKAAAAYQRRKSDENQKQLAGAIREVQSSLAVLGKFDAKNDSNLFLRDGLVNFTALAHLFGRMGDFYALKGARDQTVADVKTWLEKCAKASPGFGWREIVSKDPSCQKDLGMLMDKYFYETKGKEFRVHDRVGAYLPALVSTSVVKGDSAKDLMALKGEYDQNMDPKAGDRMELASRDVYFGYWGQEKDLETVQSNKSASGFAAAGIDKTKRFLALGETSWEKAMGLSPAEPGLSSFLEFSAGGEKMLSLGGWSDLHPIPVLKALGCKNVVYLTRVGGDAIFGQGVAKRIFRFDDVTWDDLDSSNKASVKKNNNGVRQNQGGPWSLMFNLANPQSSYSVSLAMADAVVCTNWNDFDIKKDFAAMIESSYEAPVFLRRSWMQPELHAPREIRASDNRFNSSLGFPPYAGCIHP